MLPFKRKEFLYRHSPTYTVSSYSISDTTFSKRRKKLGNNTFQTCAKFFLAETKAQWDEGDGRILLSDNTGCGAALLRPNKYHCGEVFMSAALPRIYRYSWPSAICAKFDLRQNCQNATTASVEECLYKNPVNECEWAWKEMIAKYFKAVNRHLPTRTVGNYEQPRNSPSLVWGLKPEPTKYEAAKFPSVTWHLVTAYKML